MRGGSINFRRLAMLAVAGISAGCLFSPVPQPGPWWLFGLLAVADAAYLTGLLLPARRPGWKAACFIVFGVLASALDLIQPWGPGFVGAFVALTSLALLLAPRAAMAASLPVLLAVGYAEAATSAYPWSALLNILLGFIFFFGAAAIAALNREAQQRAEQLLAQEESTRAAREEAAALAERTRLARELHDVLAHTLSGLSLQLEAARMLAERDGTSPRVLEQITLAQRQAREGMANGKRAIAALRGQEIAGLEDLGALVAGFERDTGIPTTLGGAPRLPSGLAADAGLAVYRTVQESLSNVRKHAPASTAVDVTLSWDGNQVQVRIANTVPEPPLSPVPAAPASQGSPAEPAAGAGRFGFGLSGLAERTAALGGSFTATATATGFVNVATLPLAAQSASTQPPPTRLQAAAQLQKGERDGP